MKTVLTALISCMLSAGVLAAPANDPATLGKKVFHIGCAQGKPMVGPNRVGDNLTRKTKPLETGK